MAAKKRSEAATPSKPPATAIPVRQLTVRWGEEVHQPIQFNGFRVGNIEMTVDVPDGMTAEEVYREVYARLDRMGQEQFADKLQGWSDRVDEAAQHVRR